MNHLDQAGYGKLCRSAFLVQAELIRSNYSKDLSDLHREKIKRFIDTFRIYRLPEVTNADRILELFHTNNVNTITGHRKILESWAQMEGLDNFVGVSTYVKKGNKYTLPWP